LKSTRLATLTATRWRRGLTGAVLAVGFGLLLWGTPLGEGLVLLSYDLIFLFKPGVSPQEAVIVYLDTKTCLDLKQDPRTFDRALHAQLLDRMTTDRARLVVFDIIFENKPRSVASDAEFTRAIKANGRVVLAADLDPEARPEILVAGLDAPQAQFLGASAGWGIAALERDPVIRRFVPIDSLGSNLTWTAAVLAGGGAAVHAPARGAVRWLNYYGRQGTIPNVSYCEVKDQPVGFFRDKVVFVGGRPRTPHLFDQAEEFQTPLTRWGDTYFPGVEILTTAFLNLYRGDCLERLPAWTELLILIGWGGLAGLSLGLCRGWWGVAAALLFSLLAALPALLVLTQHGSWFPWTVMVFGQIPFGLAWSVFSARQAPRPARASAPRLGKHGTVILSPSVAEVVARIPPEPPLAPAIPDHTMLRSVGMGAYGEVWLARNAVGMYRAVKLVYRAAFDVAEPYEREFRGISKFMPISLNHPKLVHLLHVGRNDEQGYFYYIMEAADDETCGQAIDPVRYSPKSLSKVLNTRGRLPPGECVDLGLELTAALEYLHQSHLIHRDIKPANIIYVNDVPKMADIGLVTDMHSKAQSTTYVGTEGYIPPEGPGTAAGDIYSLGKVLYQAATGLGVAQFPVLPSTLADKAGEPATSQLNRLILKACNRNVAERYASATELLAALRILKSGP
jgi:CHASE2 domain-containing sensor protein